MRPTVTTSRGLLCLLMILGLLAGACSSAEEAGTDTSDTTTEEGAADEPTDAAEEGSEAPADGGEETAEGGEADSVLKVGILGECEGPFGGFHEDVVGGAVLAFINQAGATSVSSTSALEGFEGGEVAGVTFELVGIGCGDDTADRIIEEVRTLVEEQGAELVIGPLSGDEAIAVAEYAKDHPEVTFIEGIAGSQEPTLQVQADNFFRWHLDGAQWNAGIGEVLHEENGWDTAVVIADDYSFGHTSAAGFIADFCAAGGEIVQKVFPPLGTTDYSSFIQQLPDPDEVDGYFWVVGGTGTNASLEAFVNAKGELNGEQHAGNLFFNPGIAQALGTSIDGAYVGGFATLPGDVQTPEIEEYLASADAAWETLPSGLSGGEAAEPSVAAGFGFFYGFYSGTWAFLEALEAVGGDLSNNHEAVREEMRTMTAELPYGDVTLDENQQAIGDTYVAQLVEQDGEIVQVTDRIIPAVDQTFGGTFNPDTPSPSRDFPTCEDAPDSLPWHDNSIPVVDGVPQTDGAAGGGEDEATEEEATEEEATEAEATETE
jgi:branched-chain amino acid transport system substrate-binding protein